MNFPILRLMRNDFEQYYIQHGVFKKLCFVFNFDSNVTLSCYALEAHRQVMHPNGIPLTDGGDGIKPVDTPFNIGTFELTKNELRSLIEENGHVKPGFLYLRFEPQKMPQASFIGYNVYFNNDIHAHIHTLIKAKNPSPPYAQT